MKSRTLQSRREIQESVLEGLAVSEKCSNPEVGEMAQYQLRNSASTASHGYSGEQRKETLERGCTKDTWRRRCQSFLGLVQLRNATSQSPPPSSIQQSGTICELPSLKTQQTLLGEERSFFELVISKVGTWPESDPAGQLQYRCLRTEWSHKNTCNSSPEEHPRGVLQDIWEVTHWPDYTQRTPAAQSVVSLFLRLPRAGNILTSLYDLISLVNQSSSKMASWPSSVPPSLFSLSLQY